MRKGNGLKFNGHDYGILFCGTDGSLMLDRSGLRDHSRQGRAPLRDQARPRRPTASQDRPQARDSHKGSRRPGRRMSQLPRLPASRAHCRPATSRSPTAPPTPATWAISPTSWAASSNGTPRPRRSRTTPKPTPCSAGNHARGTNCRVSEYDSRTAATCRVLDHKAHGGLPPAAALSWDRRGRILRVES